MKTILMLIFLSSTAFAQFTPEFKQPRGDSTTVGLIFKSDSVNLNSYIRSNGVLKFWIFNKSLTLNLYYTVAFNWSDTTVKQLLTPNAGVNLEFQMPRQTYAPLTGTVKPIWLTRRASSGTVETYCGTL